MAVVLQPPASSLNSEAACISLLEKCSGIEQVKQVHTLMIKTGLILRTVPSSRLLASICTAVPRNLDDETCSSLVYAHRIFNAIQKPNTFMWNTMIRANPEAGIRLYCRMLYTRAPHNPYTFPFLLKSSATLEQTQQIHCHIIKTGFAAEIHTANALLHVYPKSGGVLFARQIFDRIVHRDTVTWNSMMDGYTKNGSIEMARGLFDSMPSKNVVSWTTMISGYVESCVFNEALELFRTMIQGNEIRADNMVLGSALSACAHLGALDQGRWIHTYIKRNKIRLDSAIGCVLVDMYAKCGELGEALAVFEKIKKWNVPVWTAMIAGFATHGRGREALDLFADMEKAGFEPNPITFTGILTACSYAGMVEEGKLIFQRIVNPSMEHYGCMVDLLGRAGLLNEAEDIINAMPVKPNAAVWGALLNACRIHNEFEMGKRVGKILIHLEPQHGGRYVHLATMLASQGNWDEAAMVRKQMKERGIRKLAGCSSISLDGEVHEFLVGDRSHSQTREIYFQWNRILGRLKREGYIPATEGLLLDMEEEEKETLIQCHSEKLAIAFGFIRTEPGTTIRIVKNLRVCMDCHTVAKLISRVYSRKIIMRDRTRFHHFHHGECSCKDFW